MLYTYGSNLGDGSVPETWVVLTPLEARGHEKDCKCEIGYHKSGNSAPKSICISFGWQAFSTVHIVPSVLAYLTNLRTCLILEKAFGFDSPGLELSLIELVKNLLWLYKHIFFFIPFLTGLFL